MITCNLKGGLGNQMFQYATCYAISRRIDTKFLFDVFELRKNGKRFELDIFQGVQAEFADRNQTFVRYPFAYIPGLRRLAKIISHNLPGRLCYYLHEGQLNYIEKVKDLPNSFYMDGYWQSEKYFADYSTELREIFGFSNFENDANKRWSARILENPSVSIHIRRGDYMDQSALDFHGLLDLEYYRSAVDKIGQNCESHNYFIFSDDLDWAKDNLKFIDGSKFFVDGNEKTPSRDMQLMGLCNHNIIANSSFSWWGAWLNKNEDKMVCAPKKWFKDDGLDTSDICPASWMRI